MNTIYKIILAVSCFAFLHTYCFASETKKNAANLKVSANNIVLTKDFDKGVDALPPNFKGHNAEVLFRAFQTSDYDGKLLLKDKFETKAEHKARVNIELNKNLFGEVNAFSLFAFVAKTYTNYNADKKLLEYSLSTSYLPHISAIPSEMGVDLVTTDRQLPNEVKSNAFGQKAVVSTTVSSNVILAPINIKQSASLVAKGVINIPIEEAKAQDKQGVSVLFIGRLQAPYYIRSQSIKEATYGSPTEEIKWKEIIIFSADGACKKICVSSPGTIGER